MKRQAAKTKYICMALFSTGIVYGCSPNQDAQISVDAPEFSIVEASGTELETEDKTEDEQSGLETETAEAHSLEQQMQENVEQFYEMAQEQGVEWEEAARYVQILTEDKLFQDGKMALTGLRIDDIDGNGQTDMLVMVLDAQEKPYYGSGALWFYMNDDEPYCFSEENCSYYGWFDVFWDDIDSDDNVEIVFSAQGTGCGAVGDSYKAVFKYRKLLADGVNKGSKADGSGDSVRNQTTDGEKNSEMSEENDGKERDIRSDQGSGIERMQLPSDFDYDFDFGIDVEVYQEPETNQYTAYCPYFDEKISFRALNIEDWSLPEETELAGGEVRGFYNLCVAQYEGKNVLQASEYLNGEGGIVHNVATAQFLITWKEDGTPEVIKWWIEEDKNI